MGTLNQKTKKSIQKIGIQSLPTHYSSPNNRQYESDTDQCKLLRFIVMVEKKDNERYIESLKLRKENPDELIQVNYVTVKSEKQDYCKLFVFIENINLNLQQIMRLPFQEMIKILYFSLKGFQKLFNFYGKYFTIQSHMIGFNDSNELKVWSERNYAKHEPKPSYSFAKTSNLQMAESCMVKEIKQIFMCKVNKSTLPKNFQFLSTTFQRLISELEDKYGKKKFKNNFSELKTSIKAQQSNKDSQNAQNNVNQRQDKLAASVKLSESQNNGPLIRFSYSQKNINKNMNSSIRTAQGQMPKITFNNKQILKKQPQLLQVKPKTNINFKYGSKNMQQVKGFQHNISTNGSSMIEERDFNQQICKK